METDSHAGRSPGGQGEGQWSWDVRSKRVEEQEVSRARQAGLVEPKTTPPQLASLL